MYNGPIYYALIWLQCTSPPILHKEHLACDWQAWMCVCQDTGFSTKKHNTYQTSISLYLPCELNRLQLRDEYQDSVNIIVAY